MIQKSGKIVTCWALEGDLDVTTVVSNPFTMLWAGRLQEFPEIDRAEWFDVATARTKMMAAQLPYLDRLRDLLDDA